MSVDVAGDCDHTYAVVDKSKKKKKRIRFIPEIHVNPDSDQRNIEPEVSVNDSAVCDYATSVPAYSMLDKTAARARSQERLPPKDQTCSALCISVSNTKVKKKDTTKTRRCGIVLILLIVLVGIALYIAAYTFDFVQISKVRSEVASHQASYPSIDDITRLIMRIQALDSKFNSLYKIKLNATEDSNSIAAILVDVSNEAGNAFTSCAAVRQLSPSSPSGNYHVRSSNGSAISAYCDMTRTCGGITGGWMRVAELDMTDNTAQCPTSLELQTSPHRTCRTMNSISALCSSDTFSVGGVGYSKVCGRIRAYQVGSPDAFRNHNELANSGRESSNPNIETYYVDGLSLTHGKLPRQHIWTFVAALNEDDQVPNNKCPCINTALSSMVTAIPPFVGEDYFCDTAVATGFSFIFYADDPLWDGAGCGPQNTCCSFNSPPWFYKQLPQPTTDDIEMRVCRDQSRGDEDIAIEVVEIYVQ